MEKHRTSHTKFRVKKSREMAEAVGSYLRRAHPRKTSDMVAADTGISATTVSTWLEGGTVPGGIAIIRLIEVYGPAFLIEVMPSLRWLTAAAQAERLAILEARQQQINDEMAAIRGDSR